ncbi:MAG: hypothetical protein HGA45_13545 [Chloroflexales bacterium]|nr:hypothetical protein [Chloroflexales bacterium]
MPFAPLSAAPRPARMPLALPALERAVRGGVTLFIAPSGYLPGASLADLLVARGGPIVWVRLGAADRDPATLLTSLIAALRGLRPEAGSLTLEQMRRHPGPLLGWPPIFARLSQELAEALGANGALVLEGCHHLGDASQTLRLLSAHVLSTLVPDVSCVLTAERPLPPVALPAATAFRDLGDLRLGERAAEELVAATGCGLAAATARRAAALVEGRAATLLDLCAVAATLGPAPVQQSVERAADLVGLLARVARSWLVMADADDQHAIALALRLGYVHPQLLAAAVGSPKLPQGPWFAALEDDWLLLQPVWRAPLQEALRARARLDRPVLQRAAAHLVELGAVEQAVPLYLELGDRSCAAEAISRIVDLFVSLGHWETLEEWLGQLSAQTLAEWPYLVYVGGELAAAQGQLGAAQQAFTLATRLFEARRDAPGCCQSLLAESTLAVWRGDLARAEARALAAGTQAPAAGLPWQSGWAAWQLGCLAAAADDLDKALVYFGQAQEVAATLDDQLMLALPRQAELLVRRQRDLHHQCEEHRAAYWAAEQAAREAGDQLRLLLAAPQHNLEALLEVHGWARLPLLLKLLAPTPEAEPVLVAAGGGVWGRLLGVLGLRRSQSPAPAAHVGISFVAPPPPRLGLYGEQTIPAPPLTLDLSAVAVASAPAAASLAAVAVAGDLACQVGGPNLAPQAEPAAVAGPSLAVYMLGAFRVILNDRPVESWPSGRGRSVLKYLLTQRARPVPRDVLMDFFWPESSPESARNSLNVAIHGLRQAFRAVTETAVVIFENGAYRLDPELGIWVDVEEFERHVQAGRQFEESGQIRAATGEYEVAIGLYGADFLIDDPYEDWPVLTRERLRVMYLEALDRLGLIYFAQGQYAACANLCQLMLAADNCREDAHCRLMRCYARLGQSPPALRQYQACVEALRAELDVEPSPATVELYERIRRRESV